jgi:hypothetical protein
VPVYFTFHTKPALLSRAYEVAVGGEEAPVAPHLQPWHDAMRAEPDITSALRAFATGSGEIMRRVTPLYFAARVAADADADAARVMAFNENGRAILNVCLEHLDTDASTVAQIPRLERWAELLVALPGQGIDTAVYRFRILGGANARIFGLELSNRAPFWLIGTYGGLLASVVMIQEVARVIQAQVKPDERSL